MFQAKLLRFDAPLSVLEIAVAMQYEKTWMTRKEIAARLGCSKSPTLIKLLHQGVAEGQFYFTRTKMPNGVDCFWYALPNFPTHGYNHSIINGEVIFDDCP